MNEEIIKKRIFLNLKVKDLLKDMDIIDGKIRDYPNKDVSSMNDWDFLNFEIKQINDIRVRLENIFKEK